MSEKAKQVCPDCYWVGALNPDLRVFDIIMETKYGTSYNSYLVKGSEKTALFETVKDGYFDSFLERLKEVCQPQEIDYIIVSHTEPDHSGSLEQLLALCPDAKVVASPGALNFLKDMVETPFEAITVTDRMELSLGDKTIRFITAPNLHWPDTILSYIAGPDLLMTCDFLGCHYSDERVFNDLIPGEFLDAYQYYFEMIMGPFKPFVLKALDKIKDLDIKIVCPGHGPVLRKDLEKYLGLYREWATPPADTGKKLVIPYVSAYGYTKSYAEEIKRGASAAGSIEVLLFDLVETPLIEVMPAIAAADGILIGSPTIVSEALPNIYTLLGSLNPLIHKGKLAGAFGSYGWSGEAVPNIEARLTQLKLEIPVPGLRLKFKPNEEKLQAAFSFGQAFGQAILKK